MLKMHLNKNLSVAILLLVSITSANATYIKHFYVSCESNPCNPSQTCVDNLRMKHSYSCCENADNGDSFCSHHYNARNWKEIIPFTFSLILILVFMIGVWCSLHFVLKKIFRSCFLCINSNKTQKFITRIRVLVGKPPANTSENTNTEISTIVVQGRSSSPPPIYELPPSYENLAKTSECQQKTS